MEDADNPKGAAAGNGDAHSSKYHTGRLPNSRTGDGKPRLLLMGQRRSGKSSIISVIFHKLPPSKTLHLETTTRIKKETMNSFVEFTVLDCPGHLDYFDPAFDNDAIFSETGALIWVIDAQDEYLDSISRLNATVLNLMTSYPNINIEVFVHKVDCLSEDFRVDNFRDIVQKVQDELADAGCENAPISFYQTSIYDHSVFEAFSKVIQKLIPQLPTLESLLNSLCASCRIDKAYLFDVPSKIYVAADTSPSDISSYEVCSDYIDVVVDVSEIYGWERDRDRPAPASRAADKKAIANGDDHPGRAMGDDADEGLYDVGRQDVESVLTMERKGNNYLYLKEINKYLALVCLTGDDSPTDRKALIDYNVGVFQSALQKVFQR